MSLSIQPPFCGRICGRFIVRGAPFNPNFRIKKNAPRLSLDEMHRYLPFRGLLCSPSQSSSVSVLQGIANVSKLDELVLTDDEDSAFSLLQELDEGPDPSWLSPLRMTLEEDFARGKNAVVVPTGNKQHRRRTHRNKKLLHKNRQIKAIQWICNIFSPKSNKTGPKRRHKSYPHISGGQNFRNNASYTTAFTL